MMNTLNCSLGDLAITVNCNLPENRGNIVRVKAAIGFDQWEGFVEPLFTWECEIATEHGWLVYDFDGYLETYKSGPVPDKYLRRLLPPQNYLMNEYVDSEQLQLNLHELDLIESESHV